MHATDLMERLYGRSLYHGFSPPLPLDSQGWNGSHPALRRAVEEVRAAVIFDIGVWKGQSTIFLAKAQQALGIDGVVVGIDTFLGSPEHWNLSRTDAQAALRFDRGWPGLYWQFLSNVVHEGCEDRIVPMAQTSENAAVILQRLGVVPDVVHVDAAHQREPLLRDARVYWSMLRPGGILVGDDIGWGDVERTAHDFAAEVSLALEIDLPKWILRKPA